MKKTILFICGIIIGSIIGGTMVYYYLMNLYNDKYEEIESKLYKNSLPDYAEVEVDDTIIVGEPTTIKISIIKNGEKMNTYTGTIAIFITDENGYILRSTEYSLINNGWYSFQLDDQGFKEFEKGLTINKKGNFYIEIQDLNENEDKVLGKFKVKVIGNSISENKGFAPVIEIFDSEQNIIGESDEFYQENDVHTYTTEDYIYEHDYKYSQPKSYRTISPDSAEITIKDPIIVGEATNLKIQILKNGEGMVDYDGIIMIVVTNEDGTPLKSNEYLAPSRGIYSFLGSDLGVKEFQRGLEIKKEGKFYIEVSDLGDNEDKILGKQLITVVKKN